MPTWLRNQLERAFRERDCKSVVMLNRVYFKYRKQSEIQTVESNSNSNSN